MVERFSRYFVFVIFLGGLLAASRAILLAAEGAMTFSDDAFYYLIPARNCLRQGFYTFDGSHATNGFHPLWMFVVRITFVVIGPGVSDIGQTTAVIIVQAIVYLGCVALACTAITRLRKTANPAWLYFAGAALVLVYPYSAALFFSGMETTLAAFFTLALLLAAAEENVALFALVAPLLFLSRLDTLVFIIAPVGIYLALRASRRRVALASLPLIVTVATYLLLNQLSFGHPMPISGALKSSFPRIHFNPSHLLDAALESHGRYLRLLLIPTNLTFLALALVISAVALALSKPRSAFLSLVLVIPSLLIMNIVFFQQWNKSVEIWYLVLPSLCALTALFFSLASIKKAAPFLEGVAFLIACVSSLAFCYSIVNEALTGQERELTAAGLARPAWYDDSHLTALGVPKDAVLAGTDVGTAAFRSHRRVVNLDGLVNDYAYQDVLRKGGLRQYLRNNGVHYLIATATRAPSPYFLRPIENMYRYRLSPTAVSGRGYVWEFRVYSYLYHCYSDALFLTPGREVYSTAEHDDVGFESRDFLFDIRGL